MGNYPCLSKHRVCAIYVRNRLQALSGRTFLHHVGSYIQLAQRPIGKPLVRFVRQGIVGWRCMHVFLYLLNIISRSWMLGSLDILCGHLCGSVWALTYI